jgi:hypothetical protein
MRRDRHLILLALLTAWLITQSNADEPKTPQTNDVLDQSFLQNIPEFKSIDFTFTQDRLLALAKEHNLIVSIDESKEGAPPIYFLARNDGEIVAVSFDNQGKCCAIQRLQKLSRSEIEKIKRADPGSSPYAKPGAAE